MTIIRQWGEVDLEGMTWPTGERRSRVRPKIEIALSLTSCHGTAYIYPTLRGPRVLHALRRQYSSSAYNMSQRLCCIFNLTCKTQMESLQFILGGIYDRTVIRGSLNRGFNESRDRWITTGLMDKIKIKPNQNCLKIIILLFTGGLWTILCLSLFWFVAIWTGLALFFCTRDTLDNVGKTKENVFLFFFCVHTIQWTGDDQIRRQGGRHHYFYLSMNAG